MARRKIQHAKSNETNDEMGVMKTLKQQHSKSMKQDSKNTAKSKSKEPNSQLDGDILVENNTISNAFFSDSPTFCASEEKLTFQPTSEGLSQATTKNSSNISSALSSDQYEDIDEHSLSVSNCSNLDQEGALEVRATNNDSQLPITTKKSRRKPSSSTSSTPSPAPSPSSAQQSPNPITSIIGVPGSNGQFICPSCNKVVDSQSEYTRHIRQHNFVEASATTHTCSLCGKVLSSASSLDRHMLVHSGERPFKCRICGMAFTTNGNMHRHMRTHHDGAAVLSGDTSSPMQVSDDESNANRKARTYVKRKRLQSPLKASGRKAGPNPGIIPSKANQLDEGKNCNENSLGGMPQDDEWEDFDDKSVSESAKSVSSLSLASPQKKKCTEKSEDVTNNNNKNNWMNGSSGSDLDDSLRCLVCSKTFLAKMGLQNHLDSHLPNELKCKECKDSKTFPTYQALLKHCRLSHLQAVGELKSENEARGSSNMDISPLHSATVGFHDLTFIDFSSGKFALIAKSACERNVRWPSSDYHIFQCRHCKKAFPSSGSLKMHIRATHPALSMEKSLTISDAKKSVLNGEENEKTMVIAVSASTCKQCHAAFASHQQLEMHCLRHQAAEQCATPYSTVERNKSEDMDPATADFAPQLNKENFLALFELQSKTKDADLMPALTSLNPKRQACQNGYNNGEGREDDFDVSYSSKRQCLSLSNQWNNLNGDHNADVPFGSGSSNTGDFADIQSMIEVTSTASAIPSMMKMRSSPFSSRVASPPPSETLASPRLADSVTASPELPSEHIALASSSSAQEQSPAKSVVSLSSTPSSLSPSPSKSLENDKDPYLPDDAVDAKTGKEFACNQCPRVLTSLRALKAHNRIHLGESPYHCNVCPFVSAEKSTLIRHLRTHNGERPYMCTICQYAFTTKANCERHLRTKHDLHDKEEVRGAMRYMAFDIKEGGVDGSATFASSSSCPHCNLQFAQAKLLKQHLHVQHNDMYSPKPFTCLTCTLRFSTQRTCLRHISKLHPDVAKPEEAVGTTLTSLTSYAQTDSPAETRFKSLRDIPDLRDAEHETTRCQSADGASTSSFALPARSPVLDLSSRVIGHIIRPSSFPGAALIPKTLYTARETELADRPLDPDDSEESDQSSLESLINLTTSHEVGYDIPPQEQPLDLALYPMDLSYNASDETPSQNCALSPMDLSASQRPRSSFCTPNTAAASTSKITCLPPTRNSQAFPYDSISPFRSCAPSTFMSPQTPALPSRESPFPITLPALQHIPNRFAQGPLQHFGPPSLYSPNGGNYPTPLEPIGQPLTISTSHGSPTLNAMSSPSPGSHAMALEEYCSPKAEERGGRKRSGGSSGHGRAHLASTSANTFLLKKQKQRRYRTERPFKCAHCAAGFTLRSNMERHIKQQHPEFWASKARGRKLVPTNTLPMVKPSISISPIHSSAVPHNISEIPQLMSSTPAFPELLHMMQAEVEPPHITCIRTDQPSPQKMTQAAPHSLLKGDLIKTTISSKVKQAISKQIKQRKSHLELPATAQPGKSAFVPASVASTSIAAIPDNNLALLDDASSSSDSSLSIVLPPVIKVAETIFPPADENPDSVATNISRPAVPPPISTPPNPQLTLPIAKLVDDAEDTLPDLASVSKLLDTASQQNIQEMFRCSETVDDEQNNEQSEGKDREGLADPFSMTLTQTNDEKYLFHDDSAGKLMPVPAEEATASTSSESPTKSPEKARDGKRSAYNSAPNRVACPYCHRLFPWTSSLRRHILTHTGQKPHKCPICPLWFTTKSNCDRHLIRKHHNAQPAKPGKPAMLAIFPPPGVSVVVSPSLSTSSLAPDCTARNAPDRPFRCLFCLSSTFSTQKNLQKHLASKHPNASQQSPELLQGLEKTEASGEPQDEAFASGIKMEAHSDGNSNSGSEQCWGESEESGEETAPEGSPVRATCSRPGAPLFFCFVCLKSFSEREHCLQHLRLEHPTEHAPLASTAATQNTSECDEQQDIPETPSEPDPGTVLSAVSNGDASIPEVTLVSNSKLGDDGDNLEKPPEDLLDDPEIKVSVNGEADNETSSSQDQV